jgi:hypothetical protein
MAAVVQWQLMAFNMRESMFTKTKQQFEDGGTSE